MPHFGAGPVSLDDGSICYDRAVRVAGLLVSCALFAGCTREPAEALCPPIGEGDLVVTEIAGPQTGNDLVKPWIELYNASGAPIDLYGIKVRFRRLDGSNETAILVRREVTAAPGAYTVLGLDDEAELAPYLDYGFASDFHTSWLSSAAVDVEACGVQIDRARYDSLPRTGSFALGVTPPTADANDLPASWCTDDRTDLLGVPGSPQQPNPACP